MGNIQIKKKHEEKKGLTWQNIFESHLARAFGIGALMRRYNNIDTARYNHVLVLPRTIYTKHLNCNAYTTKLQAVDASQCKRKYTNDIHI